MRKIIIALLLSAGAYFAQAQKVPVLCANGLGNCGSVDLTSYSAGSIFVPTGTGFLHITTNGTLDPAAKAVDLSGSDVANVLPISHIPAFIGSGSSHAAGYVPDAGATAGTTRYLREDGTWAAPSASVTATSIQNGLSGQTGCATVGYVYVPQSNTCVAQSSGGTTFKWSCQPSAPGDGVNAITAGSYPLKICRNDTGQTETITGISCYSDTGTSTMNVANNAGTSLLTGVITCSSSYAVGTQSSTVTLAAGDALNFTFVADGTTTRASFDVWGTHP